MRIKKEPKLPDTPLPLFLVTFSLIYHANFEVPYLLSRYIISLCWNFQENLVSYIIKKSFIKIWDGSFPAFLVHEMTMSWHEMTQFIFLSMNEKCAKSKTSSTSFPHFKKTSHQMFLLFLFLLYPLTYSFFYLFLILPSISCCSSRERGGRRKIAIVKIKEISFSFDCLMSWWNILDT